VVLGSHLFVLSIDVQEGLEPLAAAAVVVVAAVAMRNGSIFSQCNVAWEDYPRARGSGCQKFDSG
jgi:hypothetical protein